MADSSNEASMVIPNNSTTTTMANRLRKGVVKRQHCICTIRSQRDASASPLEVWLWRSWRSQNSIHPPALSSSSQSPLGPLCTAKPRKEFFMPLIMTVQRRLPSCVMYLNYGSKLRILNSVLSSLPTSYLSSLKVYKWVFVEIDKYRRHCVWRDKDSDTKSPPLAAWDMVCKPKNQGGLCVINLAVQNECLLMKHVHKFYNRMAFRGLN